MNEYMRRTVEVSLSWLLPEALDEVRLEQLLFPAPLDLPVQARGYWTGKRFKRNSRVRTSPWSYSGGSTVKPILSGISVAGSVATTGLCGAS